MGPEDNSVMENDHQDRYAAKKIQLHVPLITSDLDISYIVQDSSLMSVCAYGVSSLASTPRVRSFAFGDCWTLRKGLLSMAAAITA